MSDDRCELLCLDLERAERLRVERRDLAELTRDAARIKALGDPTRLLIAETLSHGELCVCDLAWVAERSENLVSHHLRQLRAAGLASSRRDGKMVLYSLTAEGSRLLGAVVSDRVTA